MKFKVHQKLLPICKRKEAATLKKTPTEVFSCEICEIFKNTYFEERLWTTAFKLY